MNFYELIVLDPFFSVRVATLKLVFQSDNKYIVKLIINKKTYGTKSLMTYATSELNGHLNELYRRENAASTAE